MRLMRERFAGGQTPRSRLLNAKGGFLKMSNILKDKRHLIGRRFKRMSEMIGRKFNRLTVIAYTDERTSDCIVWLCQCECGKKTKVNTSNLKGGLVRSCGCLIGQSKRDKAKKIRLSGYKICLKCGIKKPFSEYYKSKSRHDGIGCYCKKCSDIIRKESDLKRIEHIRNFQRGYYRANKEHIRQNWRKYYYSETGTKWLAKHQLTRDSILSEDDLSNELVEAKALQLQLKREMKR